MKRLIAALTLLPTLAHAQDVVECNWQASARNLVEPWVENTATFSNGAVRLAKLDTIEPALGGFHLLVLSPPHAELGDRQCRVLTWENSMGFAMLDFQSIEAAYDPAVGLMFTLPVEIAAGPNSTHSAMLRLSLNQATGEIGTRVDLGRE